MEIFRLLTFTGHEHIEFQIQHTIDDLVFGYLECTPTIVMRTPETMPQDGVAGMRHLAQDLQRNILQVRRAAKKGTVIRKLADVSDNIDLDLPATAPQTKQSMRARHCYGKHTRTGEWLR